MEVVAQQISALNLAVDALNRSVIAQQTQLNTLADIVGNLQSSTTSQTLTSVIEPKMSLPERFSGDRTDFRNFRNRCMSYFKMRPIASGSETQRVTLIQTLLRGDSQTWAYSLPSEHIALQSVQNFFDAMAVIYDDPDIPATAERKLKNLRQGNKLVEEYAAEFRKWSHLVRWDTFSLLDRFLSGLSDDVTDVMISHPEPRSLDEAISLAIKVDRRVRYHKTHRRKPTYRVNLSSSQPILDEPMQIGFSKLSESERLRRKTEGLCMYCGTKGHIVANCSKKAENSCA